MSLTTELLSPVTTAAGLYPALHTLISQSDKTERFITAKPPCLKQAKNRMLCNACDKLIPWPKNNNPKKYCNRECYYLALRKGLVKRKYNRQKLAENARKQWLRMRDIMSERIKEGKAKSYQKDPERFKQIARMNGYKGLIKMNAQKISSPIKPKRIVSEQAMLSWKKNGERLKEWSKNHPEQVRYHAVLGAKAARYNKPKSHIILENQLSKYNINLTSELFIPEVPCIIDEAIPSKKIAIFCDGEKWHNYPNGTEKDKLQTMRLQNLGWNVIRFWDMEVKNNTSICINKILTVLH